MSADGDSVSIVVEDRGLAPMPARLTITREGGAVERVEVPVERWLAGARLHTVRVGPSPAIARVEIDAERRFPDADRANNVWVRGGAAAGGVQ